MAHKSHLRPTGATTYILGAILNQAKKQQVSLTKNVIPGQYLRLSPCKKTLSNASQKEIFIYLSKLTLLRTQEHNTMFDEMKTKQKNKFTICLGIKQ